MIRKNTIINIFQEEQYDLKDATRLLTRVKSLWSALSTPWTLQTRSLDRQFTGFAHQIISIESGLHTGGMLQLPQTSPTRIHSHLRKLPRSAPQLKSSTTMRKNWTEKRKSWKIMPKPWRMHWRQDLERLGPM